MVDIIEQGDVYCSKRCGFRCKRTAYDRAVAEGDALANALGEGWAPHVWDNGGWHYSASNGACEIFPRTRGGSISGEWVVEGYTCFLNVSTGQIVTRGDTAADALGFATQEARTRIASATAQLNALYCEVAA